MRLFYRRRRDTARFVRYPVGVKSFLDLCRARQSCRKYDPARPVPRELLERCVEAARLAPSACNSQPWTFLIVDHPARRDRLAAAAFHGVFSMNRFAADAPALVAVVTERSRTLAQMGGALRGVPYRLVDVGIAAEHFVLQAADEGLGTCWLGWFDAPAVKRELRLPRSARLDLLISVGWPLQPPREKTRKAAAEMSRFLD